MPSKQKYPNLPDEFRVLVKKARLDLGLSLAAVAKDLGVSTPTVSQLELGNRNFNYERAVQFRDYFEMDYGLPLPDKSKAETIRRERRKHEAIKDRFYILVDGEIIEVLSYRKLGPLTEARLAEKNESSWVKTRIPGSVDLHIWPPNDRRMHEFVDTCSCYPEIESETGDGKIIARAIVHTAYDDRPGPLGQQ